MRAQITIFIILAVLILIAFAVVFYAASLITTEESREFLVSEPVQDYITSCLDESLREGLALSGKQGGRIFVSQGGITVDPSVEGADYIPYGDHKVPYSVLPPEGSFGNYVSTPPDYPFVGFPYVGNKEVFNGFYGFNRLPPLYKSNDEGVPVQNSIEESLETYVQNYLPKCVDWSSFPSLDIVAAQPNVSLIFASELSDLQNEQFITVLLNWPITVKGAGHQAFDYFTAKVPVRLATVYFYVNDMIDKDVSDIEYHPHDEASFSARIVSVGEDTVVNVTDALSVVSGKPFEFVVARKDRIPALWQLPDNNVRVYVNDNRASIENDELVVETWCGSDRDVYRFALVASDPDEKAVSFQRSPRRFTSIGSGSLRVFASDGAREDWQDIPVEVVPCVP